MLCKKQFRIPYRTFFSFSSRNHKWNSHFILYAKLVGVWRCGVAAPTITAVVHHHHIYSFFFSLSLSVYFIYLNVAKGINMLRSSIASTLSGVRRLWTNWPKILCHHIQIYMRGGCCAKGRKWNAAARESKKPSAFFDFSFKIFNFKKTSTYILTRM